MILERDMVRTHSPENGYLEENNMFLVSRMAERRREMKISYEELAEAIGISSDEYIAYENGLEHMPASVAFLAAIILDGDPMAYMAELETNTISGSVPSNRKNLSAI